MPSLSRRIDKLLRSQTLFNIQHINYNAEEKSFVIPIGDDKTVYKPFPTLKKYHDCDKRIRLAMGPFNSGKSSGAGCAEVVMRAIEMPRCKDGVRRCKTAIIRNTRSELETTSLQTWDEWFGDLGEVITRVDPVLTRKHRFNDGNGIIELDVLFIGLDIPKDVRKLKSLELTNAWINEASEIHESIFDVIQMRVGRYPKKENLTAKYWYGVFLDTNPPPIRHWIYQAFEKDKPESFEIFHQPSALLKDGDKYIPNPLAENIENISDGYDYYLNITKSNQTEEFIKVFCMGEYGQVASGKVVYPEYNDDIHSVEDIEYVKNERVVLGWDFGLTPACLISQNIEGQKRIIKEFCLERGGIEQFLDIIILPYLDGLKRVGVTEIEASVGDVAGETASQTDMETCMDVLAEKGIITEAAETNVLKPRLDAVRGALTTLVEGKPEIIISRKGCPILREGFNGQYHYKMIQVIGSVGYRDVPNKIHPHSDIHDALQYKIMYYRGIQRSANINYKNTAFESRSVWV